MSILNEVSFVLFSIQVNGRREIQQGRIVRLTDCSVTVRVSTGKSSYLRLMAKEELVPVSVSWQGPYRLKGEQLVLGALYPRTKDLLKEQIHRVNERKHGLPRQSLFTVVYTENERYKKGETYQVFSSEIERYL